MIGLDIKDLSLYGCMTAPHLCFFLWLLSSPRYYTYAIAMITTAPPPVTEIMQNHKGYDGWCQTHSCLENLYCANDTYNIHLLIIVLPSCCTEVL